MNNPLHKLYGKLHGCTVRLPHFSIIFPILAVILSYGSADAAQSKDQYPYIFGDKGNNGLYGIKDGNGKWSIEPLFQHLSFDKGYAVGYAKYKDKYYVIDRDFNLITKKGYKSYPRIKPYYIRLSTENYYGYLISHGGKRISDEYFYLYTASISSEIEDLLLEVRKDNKPGHNIVGIDFKPITDILVRSASTYGITANFGGTETTQSAIICFERYKDGDLFPGKGLMNLKGEIIVQDRFSHIDMLNLGGYSRLYYKQKAPRHCTPEQLNRATLFLCYARNKVICYDMAGKVVFPMQKSNKTDKLIKKNMKKYIVPYLANADENDRRYTEKVFYPYYDFYSRMTKYLLDVYETAGYNAVFSGKDISPQDNLLAIARSDKSKQERQAAQARQREQARQRKQAAQSSNTGNAPAKRTNRSSSTNRNTYPPRIGSDAIYFKTSKGGIQRMMITSYNETETNEVIYQLWPYGHYLQLMYCKPAELLGFHFVGSKKNYYVFRGYKSYVKTNFDSRTGFSFDTKYIPLDLYVYIAHDLSWVKAGKVRYDRRISKKEYDRLEKADVQLSRSVDQYVNALQEHTNELRNITNDLKNNPSGGSSRRSRSSSRSVSSRQTCPSCGGSGYQVTRYSSAAASASGYKSPYHNHAGTKCPICSSTSDHYHYPCTKCYGYGHIRR